MQERHEFDSNPVSLEERLMLNFSSNVVWVLCGIIGILEGEQEGTRTWKLLTMKGHILLESAASYMRNALFNQGYLDDQFLQLEDLQDEANPNFVEEVVKLFYSDSARLIRNIELTLENTPWDFEKLDNIMHQYKGSSSSIGAKKVKKECTQFQEYCKVENIDGCMRTFQEVKQEHASLKRKLENYFQLVREAR
ncbi:histidine-containing phosphotransfer protein 4-like isoform X2 [Salvia hispanica]|uniref:histidine-containing phosphotransfer protein 4-like isoform X2 n=2 Tax=Salvia hispanica TaxID=49212 RepID=UPI00200973F1|nr:histidine-containing phosphotransfer protein 4-like isoform X2 [Salvia hispanica]